MISSGHVEAKLVAGKITELIIEQPLDAAYTNIMSKLSAPTAYLCQPM